MKNALNRIKSKLYELRYMLVMAAWDLVMGVVFIVLLYVVVKNFDMIATKIALIMLGVAFVLLSFVVKYQFYYRKYGRDEVTDGKNRKEFERVASRLQRGDGNFVMVYANIDKFKLINDTYGDDEGDRVLKKVHKIIDKELLVWNEVSGRIMADNFGMLMRYNSMEKLEHRLWRINKELAELCDDEGNSYGLKLYFGIYMITNKEEAISTMLENANMALKQVMNSSQHVDIGFFDEKERQYLGREKELELKMEKALANGEFVPFLQPKYKLPTETIGGAEALARWVDPTEGIIGPGEFVPLFEKNGFIVELDLYMFEQVCMMVERWKKNSYPVIPVSVNMSRGHFIYENFFDRYKEILDKYDVPPQSIEIELTESLFYNEMSLFNDLIDKIHEAGMLCSIDDFGSGYSSLNMLKNVKVDALKIDQVFFREADDSDRSKNIIDSVIKMAQSLDLKTISEGVEVRSQVDFLKNVECDFIQGYVFAKPMTVGQFEKLAFEKT